MNRARIMTRIERQQELDLLLGEIQHGLDPEVVRQEAIKYWEQYGNSGWYTAYSKKLARHMPKTTLQAQKSENLYDMPCTD